MDFEVRVFHIYLAYNTYEINDLLIPYMTSTHIILLYIYYYYNIMYDTASRSFSIWHIMLSGSDYSAVFTIQRTTIYNGHPSHVR